VPELDELLERDGNFGESCSGAGEPPLVYALRCVAGGRMRCKVARDLSDQDADASRRRGTHAG
jgi:hypothetical protein